MPNREVCVVASTWRYSPINNTQIGVSNFSVIVTTGPAIANRFAVSSSNEITSSSFRLNDTSCGTNVVDVSAVNLCGFQGKGSNSELAHRVNNSFAINEPYNESCDALISVSSGAANKYCKLQPIIVVWSKLLFPYHQVH